MRTKIMFLTAAGAAAIVAGLATLPRALEAQQSAAHHQAPATENGNVVVILCDGKTFAVKDLLAVVDELLRLGLPDLEIALMKARICVALLLGERLSMHGYPLDLLRCGI